MIFFFVQIIIKFLRHTHHIAHCYRNTINTSVSLVTNCLWNNKMKDCCHFQNFINFGINNARPPLAGSGRKAYDQQIFGCCCFTPWVTFHQLSPTPLLTQLHGYQFNFGVVKSCKLWWVQLSLLFLHGIHPLSAIYKNA